MDKISIEDFAVETIVGIHAWEQSMRRKVILDIDIFIDASAAARDDDIAQTVNYSEVARAITAFADENRFRLIETLAEKVAELVLTRFGARELRVRVTKPGAIENAIVSVTLTRCR